MCLQLQDQATTSPGLYDSKQMAQQLGAGSGGGSEKNTNPSVVVLAFLLLVSTALLEDTVKVPPGTPNSMSSLDWSSVLS
jgi:hypothetical protein